MFFSYPVTCADGDYSIVQGLEIDEFSRARIDATAAELVEERDAVRELGAHLRNLLVVLSARTLPPV